jgi:GTP-binding protein EngB required for normal cell division
MGLVMNDCPKMATAVDKQLLPAVNKLAGVEVLCVIPKVDKVTNKHCKIEEIVADKILPRLHIETFVSEILQK